MLVCYHMNNNLYEGRLLSCLVHISLVLLWWEGEGVAVGQSKNNPDRNAAPQSSQNNHFFSFTPREPAVDRCLAMPWPCHVLLYVPSPSSHHQITAIIYSANTLATNTRTLTAAGTLDYSTRAYDIYYFQLEDGPVGTSKDTPWVK